MVNNPEREKISFTSLPVEIRHNILSFTALVPPSGSVLIRNGRLTSLVPFNDDHWEGCDCGLCSRPFLGLNLLNVRNKSLREDAHFILFNSNQLAFTRHPAGHLRFLKGKRPWLRYIRNMRFTFTKFQIDQWITGGVRLCANSSPSGRPPPGTESPALDQTWVTMVRFIKENVPLDTLFITLDNWEARESHVVSGIDESNLPNVLDSYKAIVAPFRGWGSLGLKRFWCIWSLFIEYEIEAEHEVMGNDYTASGKETPDSRD